MWVVFSLHWLWWSSVTFVALWNTEWKVSCLWISNDPSQCLQRPAQSVDLAITSNDHTLLAYTALPTISLMGSINLLVRNLTLELPGFVFWQNLAIMLCWQFLFQPNEHIAELSTIRLHLNITEKVEICSTTHIMSYQHLWILMIWKLPYTSLNVMLWCFTVLASLHWFKVSLNSIFKIVSVSFAISVPLTRWNAGRRVENPDAAAALYLDGSLRQGGHLVEDGNKKTSTFMVKTNFTLGSIDPYRGTCSYKMVKERIGKSLFLLLTTFSSYLIYLKNVTSDTFL